MSIFEELRKTDHLIRHHHPHEIGAPILSARNLVARYDGKSVLDNLTFELKVGERLAVVGPNGAGKSTLFKVIAGVLKPSGGEIHIYGYDPSGHICIAYVPQRSLVDWMFPVNVSDVVMMGRIGKMRLLRNPRKGDWEIVQNALEVVNMQDYAKRQINELSGGQQQRVFIARALAQEAELMLMDEPLAGLDINSQEKIFEIFNELRQRSVTVMVAMHDLQMASERFDRVMLLNGAMIGIGTAEKVFTSAHLAEAYGGHLRMVDTEIGTLIIEDTCCGEGEEP